MTSKGQSLKDIKTPTPRSYTMLSGKTCTFAPLSLDSVCDIEDRYGSFDEWQRKAMQMRRIRECCEVLWMLCLNQSEWEPTAAEKEKGITAEDLWRKDFPVKEMVHIRALMLELIEASLPEAQATGNEERGAAESPPAGQSTSPQ